MFHLFNPFSCRVQLVSQVSQVLRDLLVHQELMGLRVGLVQLDPKVKWDQRYDQKQ